MTEPLTWREAAALRPGDRVILPAGYAFYFPGYLDDVVSVPPGTRGTVVGNDLNELSPCLRVLPDDPSVRTALATWDGELYLTPEPATWDRPSPLVRDPDPCPGASTCDRRCRDHRDGSGYDAIGRDGYG